MTSIRLLLIDHDDSFAVQVQSALTFHHDIALISFSSTVDDAVNRCLAYQPDVIVIGELPADVTPLVRLLRLQFPRMCIIAIAKQLDAPHARQLLSAGVSGYLLQDDWLNDIAISTWSAYYGKAVLSSAVTRALL